MSQLTIWVLGYEYDPSLRLLDELPSSQVRVIVGDGASAFASAPPADVLFFATGPRAEFEAVFAMAPRVRWVHSRFAGVDHVLFPALVESPVPLSNGQGVFARSLGEWVLFALLFFEKETRRVLAQQAAASWARFNLGELHGKTLGIVGYGAIGRAVAERARPFGLRVLALRRHPERSAEDALVDESYGTERLHELLGQSDYVVVAAPLTPETRGLIGERELEAMKPSALLVNVGRGPVVDEAALVRALQAERIRGAALDVFETEPLPADSPLWALPNVLVSPHCADQVPGWLDDSVRRFVDNVHRFLRAEPLLGLVDKRGGY